MRLASAAQTEDDFTAGGKTGSANAYRRRQVANAQARPEALGVRRNGIVGPKQPQGENDERHESPRPRSISRASPNRGPGVTWRIRRPAAAAPARAPTAPQAARGTSRPRASPSTRSTLDPRRPDHLPRAYPRTPIRAAAGGYCSYPCLHGTNGRPPSRVAPPRRYSVPISPRRRALSGGRSLGLAEGAGSGIGSTSSSSSTSPPGRSTSPASPRTRTPPGWSRWPGTSPSRATGSSPPASA